MNKLILVMIRAVATAAVLATSIALTAATVDQTSSADETPSSSQGFLELEGQRIVPSQRLDGKGAAKRTTSGAVIYGLGVYITSKGVVRRAGEVVKRLQPGEKMSLEELESLKVWSPKRAVSPGSAEQDTASSSPPVQGGDLSRSGAENPTAPAYNAGRQGGAGQTSTSASDDSATVPGGIEFPSRTRPGDSPAAQQAYPSQTDDGGSIFVMTNDQTVPRTGPDGQVGKPNEYGGVDYGGGVSINPTEDGGTVVRGSSHGDYIVIESSTGPDGGATFELGNGTSVPANGPSGQGEIVDDGAAIKYPDGTFISVDAKTGDTVVQHRDGSSEVMQGQNNREQAANYVATTSGVPSNVNPSGGSDSDSSFVMSNGRAVTRTGPDGRVGKPNQNGGVDYGGGASVNPTEDGRTVVRGSPHGDYIVIENSSGSDGSATFDLGNGTSVPANGPSGQGQVVDDGAAIKYPDGTFISVDAKTGDTVVQYRDGSSEVMQGQNNREQAANYVATTSDRPSNSGSSNDGDSQDDQGGGSSSGSGSSDTDDDEGDKDQDDESDSSEDSSDNDSEDTGGKDEDSDSGDSEGADKNLGAVGDAGNAPAGKKTVDDALARKTGEQKEPESIGPPTCGEGRGGPPGGVAEPGVGQQDCVPAGLQPGGEEEEDAEPAPILNSPIGNDVKRDDLRPEDRVGQPGIGVDRITNEGRTLEDKLQDIKGVVNPGDK